MVRAVNEYESIVYSTSLSLSRRASARACPESNERVRVKNKQVHTQEKAETL